MLTGIGEVSAELGQIATRAGVGGCLGDAYGLATEAGLGSADSGVATNLEGDLSSVDSTVVPLLDEQHHNLSTVANAEGPVLPQVSYAPVTHDDRGLGMVANLDDDVVVTGDFVVMTSDGDFDWGLEGGFGRDNDVAIDGVRINRGQGRQAVLRRLCQSLQLTRS